MIRRAWPLLLSVVLLVAFQVAMERPVRAAAGGTFLYPLDDTYIQMAIGKNLYRHGLWGATRYEFTNAGTSLVWPVMLAASHALVGLDERTPLALNVMAGLLLLGVAHALLRRYVTSAAAQAAVLVLLVVGVPIPVMVRIGMEHTLTCVAAIWCAAAGVRACAPLTAARWRETTLLPATAAALLVSLRYDGAALLVPLVLLWGTTRGWRFACGVASAALAPSAAFAAVAWMNGASVLPTSVMTKHRFADISLWTPEGIVSAFGGGLNALITTPGLLVIVLAALALLAMDDDGTPLAIETRRLLVVTVGATLVHVQFGQTGWLMRYESHLMALGIVSVAARIGQVNWRALAPLSRQRAALAGAAVVLAFPLAVRSHDGVHQTIARVGDVFRGFYQVARFLERSPSGGVVVQDVGTVAYFTDLRIVDPAGLLTREIAEAPRADTDALMRQLAAARGITVSLEPIAGWVHADGWTLGDYAQCVFAADADTASAVSEAVSRFAGETHGMQVLPGGQGCVD